MLLLGMLVGCMETVGSPEGRPPRIEPRVFARADGWVRHLATDGRTVVWASYDLVDGRSDRAVIHAAPLAGGPRRVLAEERHPPTALRLWGGYVWWHYKHGGLKRVALDGGRVERVLERVDAACFDVDDTGIYWFAEGKLLHQRKGDAGPQILATRVMGDCPVVLGDTVFWNERKGIYAVPRAGGEARQLVDLARPQGLTVHEGALYACVDDVLTRIDSVSGAARPVRSYCRPDGLAVGPRGHWFRAPTYRGWPAQKWERLAEVTADGVSWLFEGEGLSPVVLGGGQVIWFGRPEGGSIAWEGYRAPQP